MPVMGTYRSRNSVTCPLTPDEIRALVIARTRVGRRGYRPDQVDGILARVAEETAQRCRQLDQLYAENERIKNALRTWQSRQAMARPAHSPPQPPPQPPPHPPPQLLEELPPPLPPPPASHLL